MRVYRTRAAWAWALALDLVLAVPLVAGPPAATRPAPPGPVWVDAMPIPEATAIELDGELGEEAWSRAPAMGGFLQREPTEGAAATFDTEFRVAYDATHLYVAVRASDPEPDRLVGVLTRRDEASPSDWISVFVDSFLDRRSAFEFSVNPAGVKRDRYWFNDFNDDPGWDAVWDVAVRRDDRGWGAEFRIPLSQLRYRTQTDGRFGFAVARLVARLNETSTWPLLPRSASGFVSSFGELRGLALERSPRRLEIVPYAVAELNNPPSDPGNPFVKSLDPDGEVGLDLKYAIGSGLTLTATVNPDFGQVEADPAVVNLSAFETFFPERRPFFLEGSGIFRFDTDCEDGRCSGLFYSRRIGRAPQVAAEVPENGFVETPQQTTILGAAKLTGRVGSYSIGALTAFTAEETARVADASGQTTLDQQVEPFTAYTVLRARREFANQSSIGFMGTATNRSLSAPTRDTLASQAYSGGVDADWRLSKRYRLTGFWAGSQVVGEASAITALQENNRHLFQRPDAGHIDLDTSAHSLGGHAGQVMFSKNGGERTRFTSLYGFKSPGFETNDVGYMRRADEQSQVNWLQFRNDRPSKYFRSSRLNLNQWTAWNFDGDRLYGGGNVNGHVVLRSNWRLGVGLSGNVAGFDDRATRGGPGARTNRRASLWHYLESDDRRLVAGDYFLFLGRDGHDSSDLELGPGVTVRPTSALSVRTGARYARNRDDSQWVENLEGTDGTHYVFGHLDQETLGLTVRVSYTLAPTLSLQVYAEPFVSAGTYSSYKELVDGRAADYADRYRPYAYPTNQDFRYSSFRTTNVFRWEYRPGSTLFFVWQQGREELADTGSFDAARDLGHVFSVPGRNVFLVKVAYWINP